jgi:hypothetical protein
MRVLAFCVAVLAGSASLVFTAPAIAQQQQDPRVQQLEIEVARLAREIGALTRRIDALEPGLRQLNNDAMTALPRPAPTIDRTAPWMIIANWDRVKPGMTPTQVVEILGPPNTVRDAKDGTRTLFYALELGPTAILAGNVRTNPQGVVEVTKPVLR